MNPWWWLESSTDILKGLETLQYKHKVDPLVAVDSSGTFRLNKSGIRVVTFIYCVISLSITTSAAGSGGGVDVKAAKKAAKVSAAVNEHADFVRENNMVVECMGRYFYLASIYTAICSFFSSC